MKRLVFMVYMLMIMDRTSCQAREAVVLAHGMGRTKLSMALLARNLEQQGYRVVNWNYNSFARTIPEITDELQAVVTKLEQDTNVTRVHFVGHSLGGIIIRNLLSRRLYTKAGRVVMLAPPNQGSATADRWHKWLSPLMRPITGLTTDTSSVVRMLPLITQEVGIIIGKSDGKVSIAESQLAGERDHLVVDAGHSFLMNKKQVQNQIVQFLRNGYFNHTERKKP